MFPGIGERIHGGTKSRYRWSDGGGLSFADRSVAGRGSEFSSPSDARIPSSPEERQFRRRLEEELAVLEVMEYDSWAKSSTEAGGGLPMGPPRQRRLWCQSVQEPMTFGPPQT